MEKAYERYAWVLLLGLGILTLVFALMFVFLPTSMLEFGDFEGYTGMAWSELEASNPLVAEFFLQSAFVAIGYSMLGMAIFTIAISLTAYRRGKRWAWYAMWYVPVFLVLSAGGILTQPESPDLLQEVAFYGPLLIAALLGLLLPYRKFFPK